jgi:hypothetical protein
MAYDSDDFQSYGNYSALIKSMGISQEAADQMTPKAHAAMVFEAELLAAEEEANNAAIYGAVSQLSQCQKSMQWTHDQLTRLPRCHATDCVQKCTQCYAQLLHLCTMYVQSSEGILESEEKLRRHDACVMREVVG